jgi:tRNA(fMet)-specific endonuclease VapC
LKRRWSPQKVEQLEGTLRRYVVIPYDRDLAWAWARVVAACEDAGRPIAPSDAWVAAAALRHAVPLLTNNLKHYEVAESLCGLELLRANQSGTDA